MPTSSAQVAVEGAPFSSSFPGSGREYGNFSAPLQQLHDSDSDIPYLANKLRGVTAYYTKGNVPAILKDIGAKEWKDSSFLKSTFKAPSRKKPRTRMVSSIFPSVLLDQAKNLVDRLIVVNWWLNQSHIDMAAHWKVLDVCFSRPRVSSSPMGTRTNTATAAMAKELNLPPKITNIFDTEETCISSTQQSRLHAKLLKSQRLLTDPPSSDRQVFDRHVM